MDNYRASEKGGKDEETLEAAVLHTIPWKAGKGFSVFCTKESITDQTLLSACAFCPSFKSKDFLQKYF